MSCFIARPHNVHFKGDRYILSSALSLDRDWARKFCLPHLKGLRKYTSCRGVAEVSDHLPDHRR